MVPPTVWCTHRWPPPLVNYVRGFDVLTRKGKLVSTLRRQPKALSYTASLTCTPSRPALPA